MRRRTHHRTRRGWLTAGIALTLTTATIAAILTATELGAL